MVGGARVISARGIDAWAERLKAARRTAEDAAAAAQRPVPYEELEGRRLK